MRPRYSSFRIDSTDGAMVLLLEDDVVMKRLFGCYCCIDAVNVQCEIFICDHVEKFVEAALTTVNVIVSDFAYNEQLAIRVHHNWQRSECGWKCFNLRTDIFSSILLISFHSWSYVNRLGLNACKWVASRTGMYLFPWCGLVLFRLDETTNITIYVHLLVCI